MMAKYIVVVFVLFTALAVAGQEQPAGEIEDQQVIIEKDKPLTLPKANRIYQRTEIRAIEADHMDINYQITQPAYNFNPYFANFDTKSYQSTSVDSDDFRNYVKAGYGNYGSPLVQGYFGAEYEGNNAGIWLNHESFRKGPVRDEESAYGLSEFLMKGTLSGENISLNPEIYYQRESYYFYGYDAEALDLVDPLGPVPFITDRIVANHFSLGADVNGWQAERYQFTISPFYRFTDMREQSEDAFNVENEAGIEGDLEVTMNDLFSVGLNAGFSHFAYESGGLEQVRNITKVNPYLTFRNDLFQLKAGLNYFLANDSLSTGATSYFYPDVETNVHISESFDVFAVVSGELKPTTLDELRLANRYLQDSLALLNQDIKLHARAGVSVNLTEKALLRGFVQYRQINNRPLFYHSPADSSRFSVLYDPENFSEFSIGAEGKYHIGNKTAVSANLLFSSYETDTVSEAWYLPTVRFDLVGSHSINEMLKLRTSVSILGGIKAPDPVSFKSRQQDAIVNFGFGAQYDFIPEAGVFVELDNILSTDYERYLNYPSRSIMIKLGFIYRF